MIIPENPSDEEKIDFVKEIVLGIKEARKNTKKGAWDNETLLAIYQEWDSRSLLPEPDVKIEYVEKPKLSSKAKLEYMKFYHMRNKKYKEQMEMEKKRDMKRAEAIKRKTGLCIKCNKIVELVEKKIEIVHKKNRSKPQINIVCKCGNCGRKLKFWGGYDV